MTDNIYEPPTADLIKEDLPTNELATRKSRLGAAIVDMIISMTIMVPIIMLLGGFGRINSESSMFMTSQGYFISFIAIIVFICLHGRLLYKNGQTIGKKLLKIKIVNLEGEKATIKRHILPRYGFTTIISYIPIVSSILPLVDVLFIFREDRRCLHDLIAKTKVVKI